MLNFFWLVLEVLLYLIPNTINKSLGITKVFLKKIFKVETYNEDSFLSSIFLILRLMYYCLAKELNSKKNLIFVDSFSSIIMFLYY